MAAPKTHAHGIVSIQIEIASDHKKCEDHTGTLQLQEFTEWFQLFQAAIEGLDCQGDDYNK